MIFSAPLTPFQLSAPPIIFADAISPLSPIRRRRLLIAGFRFATPYAISFRQPRLSIYFLRYLLRHFVSAISLLPLMLPPHC